MLTRVWNSAIDSLSLSLSSHERFILRQEQEKHQSALMLYNKTREQLQRKEEQQRAEAEERHKAELKVRSLELEIRALKNSIKQVNSSRLRFYRPLLVKPAHNSLYVCVCLYV